MNIAIVGFGKMGHMIFEKAIANGENVVAIIDPWSPSSEVTAMSVDKKSLNGADVVIDFSHPACALENIHSYAEFGIPAVVGTTGWYDDIEEVKKDIALLNPAIIYSGNFSLGVCAYLSIAKAASAIMNNLKDYEVCIKEVHHTQKKDAPSGTALMLANTVLPKLDSYTGYAIEEKEEGKITIHSERIGNEPGLHELTFTSAVDEIKLSHHAFSREGFASGALVAAKWISDGRRGLFTMDDFSNELLGGLV